MRIRIEKYPDRAGSAQIAIIKKAKIQIDNALSGLRHGMPPPQTVRPRDGSVPVMYLQTVHSSAVPRRGPEAGALMKTIFSGKPS